VFQGHRGTILAGDSPWLVPATVRRGFIMAAVLIVDDEPTMADALAPALEGEGHTTMTVSSGRAALAVLTRRLVDLVLSDLMMPDLDGRELMAAVRAGGDRTPFILMSAVMGILPTSDRMRFLAKPLNLDELFRVVDLLLADMA